MTQAGTSVKFYLNGICVGTGENADKISPKDMGITTQNYLGKSQWSSDAYCDHIYDDLGYIIKHCLTWKWQNWLMLW